jgi:hypothetical protein
MERLPSAIQNGGEYFIGSENCDLAIFWIDEIQDGPSSMLPDLSIQGVRDAVAFDSPCFMSIKSSLKSFT